VLDAKALAPKQAIDLSSTLIAFDHFVFLQEGAKEYFASFFNFLDFSKIFFLTAIVIIRFMFLSVYSSIDFAPLDAEKVKAQVSGGVDRCDGGADNFNHFLLPQ
jgi:hypothetical protein